MAKTALDLFSPVATVLTVYGIETHQQVPKILHRMVATVLTVYGIETYGIHL